MTMKIEIENIYIYSLYSHENISIKVLQLLTEWIMLLFVLYLLCRQQNAAEEEQEGNLYF